MFKEKNTFKEDFINSCFNVSVNEAVVHEQYGIGKFLGIVNLKLSTANHDFAKLLYANEDVLYIPVENMHLIKKYGYYEFNLDKLGSSSWEKRKLARKKALEDYSMNLIKIATHRKNNISDAIKINLEQEKNFLDASGFQYTQNQIEVINDIKNDLQSSRLINRLICGEVGSGKTEIAMFSIFFILNAFSNAQAAFLCPTTVLCSQHFNNFKSRFSKFGFKVVALSNAQSKEEVSKAKESINNGEADIIIGTHALLSDSLNFCNLKMLIIDEEQHFGVKQKSALSSVYPNIHTILLSATPIPRTLHLAMNNIYDISLVTEKPFSSSKIHTEVINFDIDLIKVAVRKEVERNGQIFYVTPKIANMEKTLKQLEDAFPDLKVSFIHGQMSSSYIEKIMNDFCDKKINILLSTILIASGIDIPNANTIFIEKPQFLGLSQLYQLRGRVARGQQDGYVFFILDKEYIESAEVKQRLEIIKRIDKSGHLALAKEDLKNRGGGNALGIEQSGHMKDVGIEMYYDMLNSALQRDDRPYNKQPNFVPVINAGVDVFIPKTYIYDADAIAYFYNMTAKGFNADSVEQVENQVLDEYGPMPQPAKNFFMVSKIRNICIMLNISKINIGDKAINLFFLDKTIIIKITEHIKCRHSSILAKFDENKLVLNTNFNKQNNLDTTLKILTAYINSNYFN
jgi:transcription-repair coupling factor (superfamily II helicase)